jgi:hypothetical protein
MRWVLWLAVVALVILSGCGGSPESGEDATTVSTAVSSSSPTHESAPTMSAPPVSIAATTSPTTTTAAPPTSTSTASPTTTTATLADLVVLRDDSLGVVEFGDSEEHALEALRTVLGEASDERITEAPFGEDGDMGGGEMACWTATGTTCFDYLRVVTWDSIGLTIIISDWTVSPPASDYYDRELEQVLPNLRGYEYWGGESDRSYATEAGITIGSTVDALFAAYGDRLGFSDDPCVFDIAGFYVTVDAEGLIGLRGELGAAPHSPEAVVSSIGAGSHLGNC